MLPAVLIVTDETFQRIETDAMNTNQLQFGTIVVVTDREEGSSASTSPPPLPTSTPSPGGNVNFYNGSTALGAAVRVTNGTAAFSVSNPPVGLDSNTAVYSGDSCNFPATLAAIVQLVTGQTSVELDRTANGVTHGTVIPITLQ